MLRAILVAIAFNMAIGSFPALAQKKSCEEYCRTGPCKSQGMGSVNSCMSNCTQKCTMTRMQKGGK